MRESREREKEEKERKKAIYGEIAGQFHASNTRSLISSLLTLILPPPPPYQILHTPFPLLLIMDSNLPLLTKHGSMGRRS